MIFEQALKEQKNHRKAIITILLRKLILEERHRTGLILYETLDKNLLLLELVQDVLRGEDFYLATRQDQVCPHPVVMLHDGNRIQVRSIGSPANFSRCSKRSIARNCSTSMVRGSR